MGFPTGDIKLSANFELNVSKPLDARNVVTNFSDLANISFKYAGMIVFVIATNKHYGLKNNLTTWEVINSGTSGSGGGSLSAGNGLTISSGVIQLGGTLTNTLTSINLNNKALRFVNGANTLMNIDEGLLYDNVNKESVDTVNRFLKDSTEKIGLNWNTRVLSDKSTSPKTSIHWQNRTMNSTTGVVVADWNNSLNMNADVKFGSGTNKALKGTSVYFSNYNNELRLSESGKFGLYLQSSLTSNANVRGVINVSGLSIDSSVYDGSSNTGALSIAPTIIRINSASASNATQLALEPTQVKFKTTHAANYAIFKTTNITSANRTFEYPNNSGTIALTSDLYQSGTNFFLPISGGTMLGNITMGYNRLLKGSSKTTPSFGNQNWDNVINISNNGYLAGMSITATNRDNASIYTNVTMNSAYQVTVGGATGSGQFAITSTNALLSTSVGGASYLEANSSGFILSTNNSDGNPSTQHHAIYHFNTDKFSISTRAGYTGLYGYKYAHLKTNNLVQFDRTFEFPDKSGTIALAEDIAAISLINNTYYVSVQHGNDSSGQKGNILKPFKSIKTAVNASTAGDVVHVFAGLYDEYHIPTKSYLSIHLEDGVKIEPTFNSGVVSIFSDLILGQAAYNFRITGKGELLCNSQAGNDSTTLVASYPNSKYFIEAKKVRSLEACGQIGAYIYVKDAIIDFEANAYAGGELYFENCSFINLGTVMYGYGNQGYNYSFKDCYFERNGTNFDFYNVYGNDDMPVLYIAPFGTFTEKANILFDNCEFVNKIPNKDIMYIQSVNYDSSAGMMFNNCKFYNIDSTKKSIVFTTDGVVAMPFGVDQSDSYENGNMKFFFQNNISNVDVDNVNTLYPMTNELPSSGFVINSYFKLNSKFIG